jgi:hypothetical protein
VKEGRYEDRLLRLATRQEGKQWKCDIGAHPLSYAAMEKLILKRASDSRPSGDWNDDDYDVLSDGTVVGRILKAAASPVGAPWMWILAYGYHEDRSPTQGYESDRAAAMKAFAKSWRRE